MFGRHWGHGLSYGFEGAECMKDAGFARVLQCTSSIPKASWGQKMPLTRVELLVTFVAKPPWSSK